MNFVQKGEQKMFGQFVALVRGRSHEAAEAALAPHGVTILRQQIRDCAAAIAAARRAVAVAVAQNAQELEQHARMSARIADLEVRAIAALEQGRHELAREAAETIALLEDECATSAAAQQTFDREIGRLRAVVAASETRLRDLQR
ncbi:PspA/IM30 family protein, partial [Salmonella enterica subsp. enterica]|nr:PspA/IM30 family protein [Salmonella enterica subsp. enterica]